MSVSLSVSVSQYLYMCVCARVCVCVCVRVHVVEKIFTISVILAPAKKSGAKTDSKLGRWDKEKGRLGDGDMRGTSREGKDGVWEREGERRAERTGGR